MKLSIVVPAYNEKDSIAKVIDLLRTVPITSAIDQREIVVVDDCSIDGTKEILNSIDYPELRVFHHDVNQGKGAALRTGFAKATGDIVIVQDADLEYDPNEFSKLLGPIIDGKADVVFGSRFAGGESHRILYYWHSVGNKFLTFLSNMLSDLNLTDMEVCYKVFKREVLQKFCIEEDRFGIEPEVTAKVAELAREQGIRIYEVGISYHGRTYAEGKKIGVKDGFRALLCIYKYNTTRLAKFLRYAVNGLFVALSQFITIITLVDGFGLRTVLQQNISNIVSIEISILTGFVLHFTRTWRERYSNLTSLIKRLSVFHLVTLASLLARVSLFYPLSVVGFDYRLNALIGIGIAVILNFIGYDKLVFSKRYFSGSRFER